MKEWRWDREKQKEKRNKNRKDKEQEKREVEVERVVQITRRDEELVQWLGVVRMADMDAIRWAMGGLNGAEEPVSVRVGQKWVARLLGMGLIDRTRLSYQDSQIVWATHTATGRVAPNLYRQTTRHELAVAAVSARYLARGFQWFRDARPQSMQDHQVDGVAVKGDVVELVEVELTAKALKRYKLIHNHHASRLSTGGVSRVVYVCTKDAARAVAAEADKFVFRDLRHRLVTLPVFDVKGKWIGDDTDLWDGATVPVTSAVEVPTPQLWDRESVS